VLVASEEGSERVRRPSVDNPSSPSTWADTRLFDGHQALNETDRASQAITAKISPQREVISVAMIDEHSFTRASISRSLRELCSVLDIDSFATGDQCLGSTKNYDLILYHVHENRASWQTPDEPLGSIKKIQSIAPVVILSEIDYIDSVIAAFESGVRGYIPTINTTPELAIEIIRLVRAGGTFVPPSSLSSRRSPNRTTQEFTPRQMAVLDRLKLGKTNKIIAFELEMSESSVKAHIQNIMKKMKVTNRTEVVCRAHELEIGRAQPMD
jgi:DNA-binding NarL/FixJ family response regulator